MSPMYDVPRLEAALRVSGLTLDAVAKRAGVSIGTAHRVIHFGRAWPKNVDRVARVLGFKGRLELLIGEERKQGKAQSTAATGGKTLDPEEKIFPAVESDVEPRRLDEIPRNGTKEDWRLHCSGFIVDCRKRSKMTQEVFAKKIGIRRETVAAWSSGKTQTPTIEHLARCAELANVKFEDCLTLPPDPKSRTEAQQAAHVMAKAIERGGELAELALDLVDVLQKRMSRGRNGR